MLALLSKLMPITFIALFLLVDKEHLLYESKQTLSNSVIEATVLGTG